MLYWIVWNRTVLTSDWTILAFKFVQKTTTHKLNWIDRLIKGLIDLVLLPMSDSFGDFSWDTKNSVVPEWSNSSFSNNLV